MCVCICVYVHTGTDRPTVALVYQDNKYMRHLKAYQVTMRDKASA